MGIGGLTSSLYQTIFFPRRKLRRHWLPWFWTRGECRLGRWPIIIIFIFTVAIFVGIFVIIFVISRWASQWSQG